MAQIAVVDDKEILRDSLTETLKREDHKVTAFADPIEALAEIKSGRFDLALVDLKMPRMDGISLIREARAAGCDSPMIMMTAFATVSTAVEAMKLGAVDYIQKPFDADAVAAMIDRALEHARLRRENEALRTSVEDLRSSRNLIGGGPSMTRLRAKLDRVAASHDTVLITGESGTGKELVASYIHRGSPRDRLHRVGPLGLDEHLLGPLAGGKQAAQQRLGLVAGRGRLKNHPLAWCHAGQCWHPVVPVESDPGPVSRPTSLLTQAPPPTWARKNPGIIVAVPL